MAQHAEPMDIDDEGDFDNKENTYQHSNVLPKTPCTEKGYEELDVSELNMKLRYSITPAASPMSKSMSHCLDNQQNNLTDESLNNTVINDYEHNLTRSLNSTLNKTAVTMSKILPLQALPTDVDGNRNSVLRSLDPESGNDITITVSNENEIDNLSFPSSSSSMAQTPEATTPTKEIPKHDGGSPIMRGLKSVLSMFRSSQSPIPPEEDDPKATQPVLSPADVPLPESKPRAIASTPKSENTKEKSLSRRNSPHKESIVFNEDLEKELQWNDDSTIVFSNEKIPIHKLFFQDKPSKSSILNENVPQEDANSSVEYMDVSYNNLSIEDKTLNGTENKSIVNELVESDGEFIDCETTFTQNEANLNTEVNTAKTNDGQLPNAPEKELVENVATVVEPFTLDTTKDIINSIDDFHVIVEGDLGKPLDFSTTDIVNQLSGLINESETSATNVISVENKDTVLLEKHDSSIVSDVQITNKNLTELPENQVTHPVNIATDSSYVATDQVSTENKNLVHTAGTICHTMVPHLVSVEPTNGLAPVDDDNVTTRGVASPMPFPDETETTKTSEGTSENAINYPSPVDIPLPNDDDINDNLDENICNDLQDKDTLNASTSQNALMAALDKSIVEVNPDVEHTKVEPQIDVITCPPSLLPSDVPLPNKDKEDLVKTTILHEAITVVLDPAHSPVTENPDTSYTDVINNVVNIPITDTTVDIPGVETKTGSLEADNPCPPSVSPTDIPLPGVDDDHPNDTQDLAQQVIANVAESLQIVTEKPDQVTIENSKRKVDTSAEIAVVILADIDNVESEIVDVAIGNTMPNLGKAEEEHMEISFVECNNDKLSETMNMDVSMGDAIKTVEDTKGLPEKSKKDTQSFNVIPELSETANDNIKSAINDIVIAENLAQNQENKQISDSVQLETENKFVENINKEVISGTVTDKDLMVNESKSESFPLPETEVSKSKDVSVTKIAVDNNVQTIEGSKIHDKAPVIPDIVSNLNTTSTLSIGATVPTNPNEKEICYGKDNLVHPLKPEGFHTTIHLDSTYRAESGSGILGCEKKIDEEIILSESNSPFVSMSAEEEFDPESKKNDFEKIDHPFATESKVIQSPPISPKIVSKGYNFNFDDIDNINPFATKTKIRMSPPPGASPNNSLTTDKLNKTEVLGPSKSEKDVNRRKSMPERKKPLKAKRHLNSSVDTEKASPKTTPSKNDDLKSPPKIQIKQEQPQLSQPELNQHDITIVAPVKEEANNDNIHVAIPSEIITHQDKVGREPTPTPSLDNPKDETVITEDKINLTQNNEATVVEDVVMSASDKSPAKTDTCSSEQSTYFSAGASSTELTESKNVFNLPELDSSNPFVTKSKIRQSPETSFVVTEKDSNECNDTVTMGNEVKLKEANCSGSSTTSDEKDVTVHEVHTEDEDTLEGPFLEVDDGNEGENKPELPDDKVDVVDFDNIHQQDNDDAAEMFIDAEAFEFLMNKNKTDEVAYSGKESLFLKFDPLFASRVTSGGVAAVLSDIKSKQITPKKTPRQAPPKEVKLLSFEKPVAGPSDLNGTYEAQSVVEERFDDMNVTASKPMLAVTPAVNPVVTPRKSLTPSRSNRLSMTFTSPAMAVIDRLLSLSGNSPTAGFDTTVTHADRSHSETDQALTQLRELLAEKEIHVYNLRCETKELKDRLSTLETQMKTLEAESAERLKKVNKLNENLAEKTKMNRNMAAVVEEYERTIASLISETEQDKKRFAEERNQLIRDRDEQTAHLASMEVSFNDLHSKYEKSKQVILGYKTNEEAYIKSIQEFEENLAKMHTNYELLKQHATSKLNHANQELEKINKAHEGEILKFNAMLKRKEVHITSLEESLAQKTKANEELTAICDELINKVG
ncbi:uncharacterized protein LOC133528620 [Cydia pomonella]|uniref:uncharacterized protein LOC133528620 n=1 Tax=Cydia pomonella TaxID=82600 RepID=UPI002ADDA30D|nr:uncharacterized protein LOC133528620 [Cydia pomonella]